MDVNGLYQEWEKVFVTLTLIPNSQVLFRLGNYFNSNQLWDVYGVNMTCVPKFMGKILA